MADKKGVPFFSFGRPRVSSASGGSSSNPFAVASSSDRHTSASASAGSGFGSSASAGSGFGLSEEGFAVASSQSASTGGQFSFALAPSAGPPFPESSENKRRELSPTEIKRIRAEVKQLSSFDDLLAYNRDWFEGKRLGVLGYRYTQVTPDVYESRQQFITMNRHFLTTNSQNAVLRGEYKQRAYVTGLMREDVAAFLKYVFSTQEDFLMFTCGGLPAPEEFGTEDLGAKTALAANIWDDPVVTVNGFRRVTILGSPYSEYMQIMPDILSLNRLLTEDIYVEAVAVVFLDPIWPNSGRSRAGLLFNRIAEWIAAYDAEGDLYHQITEAMEKDSVAQHEEGERAALIETILQVFPDHARELPSMSLARLRKFATRVKDILEARAIAKIPVEPIDLG